MESKDTLPIIISETAVIHGRGSDRYKWVSGLTKTERDHLRNGTAIVITYDGGRHHAQTAYKQCIFRYGGYCHKNYYGDIPE